MTNNFEFDDFDTQINCEEMSGPTDQELQELMAEGEWNFPEFEPEWDGESVEEMTDILKTLGFNVITFE